MINRIRTWWRGSPTGVVERSLISALGRPDLPRNELLARITQDVDRFRAIRDELHDVAELTRHPGFIYALEKIQGEMNKMAEAIVSVRRPSESLILTNPAQATVDQIYLTAWQDYLEVFTGVRKEYDRAVTLLGMKSEELMAVLRSDNGHHEVMNHQPERSEVN